MTSTEYQRKWRAENPEKVAESYRKWRASNPGRAAENKRKWRAANPEKAAEHQHKWMAENPGKVMAALRKWRVENRLEVNLRHRLGHALRGKGTKSARTLELLGCPVIWLEVHLESLFKPGMTWENYGPVWHVDHIKPCAKYDLSIPDQQRACFHWTNLQPLFALENMKKGAR